MKNFFFYLTLFISFIIIFSFIGSISIYFTNSSIQLSNSQKTNYYFSNSDFFWPTPGYHRITSHFGKRISPTTGASSNHSGIDISASEGASIFSILSGTVTFTGFLRSKWSYNYYRKS